MKLVVAPLVEQHEVDGGGALLPRALAGQALIDLVRREAVSLDETLPGRGRRITSRLASSGHAWGAFTEDRLVSVACTFSVGERYEEVGVVTVPEFRGMGLSVACAGALCADIQGRGRIPSWSTSPDNTPSLRVAQKLGFELRRRSRLYVVGMPVPEPARRDPAA